MVVAAWLALNPVLFPTTFAMTPPSQLGRFSAKRDGWRSVQCPSTLAISCMATAALVIAMDEHVVIVAGR